MKKIAVTGANGFVGRHLVEELRQHNYEVLAISGRNLPDTESIEGVTGVSVDLLNPDEAQKLDLIDVDAIVHLAGLAAVGPSFDDPEKYLKTNPGLQENLFERAIQQGVTPRFLIISSGGLYDPNTELPITESSKVSPNSPYAQSKVLQEEQRSRYIERGFEVMVARPFNHIGPGQGLGFLIPDLASQVMSAGESGQILVGNLDAKRDYTDVRDIVRAYRLLIESGKSDEIYNVCSGTSRSGHEILEAILKASGGNVTVQQDPARMRPADTPDIYGSHQKLTAATGWQPEISLDKTIEDVVQDWRQRS